MQPPVRRSRPQIWLDSVFTKPSRPNEPNGDPLFTYQISDDEYSDLVDTLRETASLILSVGRTRPWSACFCIFVAEFYRREYEGPWSWAGPLGRIGIELEQSTRMEITVQGLDYWNRSLLISKGDGNNDYLGTLFSEGGLPWRQVSGGDHGFGRAVRAGLKHWHSRESVGGDLVSQMARFDHNIPAAFQNPGTHELMAGIVTELMRLADAVPMLANEENPISLLDRSAPGWRNRFPVPLGEHNGRALVESWLRAAAGEYRSRLNAERQRKRSESRCRTTLNRELPDWSLQTEVTLPGSITFDLEGIKLSSTRILLIVYEGDSPIARVGTLLASLDPEARRIEVNLRERQFSVERLNVDQSLAVHAFSNGVQIGRLILEQTNVALDSLPLIFDRDGEDWVLVGATSTSVKHHQALVRLPISGRLIGSPLHDDLCTDELGGAWVELHEHADIHTSSGNVRIEVGSSEPAYCPVLKGIASRRDTLPSLTWYGWPAVTMDDGSPVDASQLEYRLDDKPIALSAREGFVGRSVLVVKHSSYGVVLRRQIGVLPKDLRLTVLRATENRLAQVILNTSAKIQIGVEVAGRCNTTAMVNGYRVEMQPVSGDLPSEFALNVTGDAHTAPVTIRLPYPGEPARLVGADGITLVSPDLVLNELLGLRLILTPGARRTQTFHIDFELIGNAGRRLFTRLDYEVEGTPLSLPLDGLREDIERMLSARSDLDGHVRVRVETNSVLCQFSVRRFGARLRIGGTTTTMELSDLQKRPVTGRSPAQAMSLSDPEQSPVSIPERLSDGVGTGIFELPSRLSYSGPWLIHPPSGSKMAFRPYLIEPKEKPDSHSPVTSLQQAAVQFDFRENFGVFDSVVAMMAKDLNHSGWRYLGSLATRYAHLPLSSFQAWKSVARSPDALVAALMKLDVDRTFTRRFETELAVIWEQTPLSAWKVGIDRFRLSLETRIAIPSMITEIIRIKLNLLSDLLPALTDFLVSLSGGKALPPCSEIMMSQCMALWYQQLLRSHAEDRWPTQLSDSLDRWYKSQSLLPPIPAFSAEHPDYVRPVCQLPLFMACLTNGSVTLSDLDRDEDAARFDIRLLSDFDRYWYESVYPLALSLLVMSPSRETP